MDIAAKETKYNGRLYRSRLEARWAVVFDALNLQFEYEPVRFESKPGKFDKIYSYLPDFYFPEFDLYGEVKPTKEKLFEEQDRISWAMDYNFTPMSVSNGLLLLGQIPYSNVNSSGYGIYGNYLCHYKGVLLRHFILTPFSGSKRICLVEEDGYGYNDISGWSCLPETADVTFEFCDVSLQNSKKHYSGQSDLHRALLLGRSARFDFDDSIPKMLKERRTIIGGGVRMDNRPGAASQKTLDDLKRFIGDGK